MAVRSLVFATHLIVPVIAAVLTYHLCEEPARRFIQRLAKTWRSSAEPVSSLEEAQLSNTQ
ncbi:MAG: hypothetical protein ACKVH8_23120 [Pirellulales bacterium]